MDRAAGSAYMGAMDLSTRLFTIFRGRLVGTDSTGNRYYEQRKPRAGQRPRRWVDYANMEEATNTPPEWHAWLHYTVEHPIPEAARKPWQKPYMPNPTGTAASYRPPGHDYRGGHRQPATGDYEAWTPGS